MFGQDHTRKPGDGRAEGVRPVPEAVAGTVLPGGRGQELHGVPLSGSPELVDDYEMGDMVTVPPIPEEPDPIPVRVISSTRRELKRWRVVRYFLARTSQPVQILGQDDKRTKVVIQNLGSDNLGANMATVFVSDQQHLTSAVSGYALPPVFGAEVTLTAETPVWARVDPAGAGDAHIAVLVEYVTETEA